MRILYITDLHGDTWKYRRLIEIAEHLRPSVVINGGDMLPKNGDLFHQNNFIAKHLVSHFEQFQNAGIYYLCYLGNDDLRIFDELFDKVCGGFSYIKNMAQRKVEIEGYKFIGMNWVVDYPFRLKDRCRKDTEDYQFQEQFGKGLLSAPEGWQEIDDWFSYADTLPTIEEELGRLPRPVEMSKAVYIMHMPPYKLGLDKCGHGAEVGSKAIYDFLLKEQPLLSLHGHIHESPEVTKKWQARLGNTICIQPGQLDDEFTYVTIDLAGTKIERIKERKPLISGMDSFNE